MKIAERIVIVALLLVVFGGAIWLYFTVTYKQAEVREAVARGEYQIPDEASSSQNETEKSDSSSQAAQENWREYYPVTVPMVIGPIAVAASVADTLPERIKGLSGTPYIPDGVVKLFAFGVLGSHSIWMKDMNYAIDIIWVSKEGEIVHIEEEVAPETYPNSFSSPIPAWYVIEAKAGFVSKNKIKEGDAVLLVE